MLMNMFRRAVKTKDTPQLRGFHGNDSEDEMESSALIAGSNSTRFTVSETYVVPDINGQFPTDLSDSDDDFFEKTCPVCQEPLDGISRCENCGDNDDEEEEKVEEVTQQHCQCRCSDKTNKHTNKHTDKHTYKHTDKHTYKHTDKPVATDENVQTDQTDKSMPTTNTSTSIVSINTQAQDQISSISASTPPEDHLASSDVTKDQITSDQMTRTTKTYTKEEVEAARHLQKTLDTRRVEL